ncbi:glycerophosphoryl diester phosphodiesterase [Trichoderma arundinaceum]|uniref:Glycerophosphoryl diester phosphodiesterase n=1 Tax=Trichoderma arundinaceum TaxID=490622 RepID=A0A395NE62_TRIAR|nr:glycerophosphoryl diester phosphodiesterase [Trichoderma arundinaceum]
MTASERQPLMSPFHRGLTVPKAATWASAIASRRDASRRIPQTIAHRGFRASFPENSMAAFRAAVDVGAHALETDVHLSKDGVVVLSHDPSLKRCFGVDLLIKDCTWSYLSSLRTVREPHEPLPRLVDLLEYLVSGPETEKIWVLLDIKIDDKPEDLLRAIACAFTEVSSATPWDERIIIGCWNATFMKAALSYLPGFPLAHISISPFYSRHFLPIPNLAFNMFQFLLVGPLGKWFLRDAKKAGRPVFAWTVNDDKWMEWCIRKNIPSSSSLALPPSSSATSSSSSLSDGKHQDNDDTTPSTVLIDGVITDDPKLFLQVCSRIEDDLDGKTAAVARRQNLGVVLSSLRTSLGTTCGILFINVFATSFFWYRRLQGRMDKFDIGFFRNFQS